MHALAPSGPVLLRRLLLVLVTALIVARPLVLGEEPGLSANLADPWGMVLTLLWLLAAVGWAAWRYWLPPLARNRRLLLTGTAAWYRRPCWRRSRSFSSVPRLRLGTSFLLG